MTQEQFEELRSCIPALWAKNGAANRLLSGLDEAMGLFDAFPPGQTAADAVSSDIGAIRGAALTLLEKIISADQAARVAIDCEAEALAIDLPPKVAWNPSRRREDGTRSILADLWELAQDVARAAEGASGEMKLDRNQRPDRVNAKRFAHLAISEMSRSTGRRLPCSGWVFDLVATAGAYRGLKVGKDICKEQLKFWAVRSDCGGDRVA